MPRPSAFIPPSTAIHTAKRAGQLRIEALLRVPFSSPHRSVCLLHP